MKTFLLRLPRPLYNLLGATGAFLLVASFFSGNRTLDFHLHDTYFIVATGHLLLFFGGYFLLLWMVYRLAGKKAVKTLTRLHIWLTLSATALFVFLFAFPSRLYVDLSSFRTQNRLVAIGFLLFLLAQVLFVVNLVTASLRKTAAVLAFLVLLAGCERIETGKTLRKEDTAFLRSLGLLDEDETVILFYSNFKKSKAGNFFTDRRIAHYWIDDNHPERNDTSFAFYRDVAAMDTVYTVPDTFAPYLTVTRKDGRTFKVYADGEKKDIKAFYEGAIGRWMGNTGGGKGP